MRFIEPRLTRNITTNHTANLIFNNQKLIADTIFPDCRISIMNGKNEYLERNASNGYAHLYITPILVQNGVKYYDWDNSFWVYVTSNAYKEKGNSYIALNEHIKSSRLKILIFTRKGWDLIPFTRIDSPNKKKLTTKKGKINYAYMDYPLLINETKIYFNAPFNMNDYVSGFTDPRYLKSVCYESYRARKPIKITGEGITNEKLYKSLKEFYDRNSSKIGINSYNSLKSKILRGKGKISLTTKNNKKIYIEQIKEK